MYFGRAAAPMLPTTNRLLLCRPDPVKGYGRWLVTRGNGVHLFKDRRHSVGHAFATAAPRKEVVAETQREIRISNPASIAYRVYDILCFHRFEADTGTYGAWEKSL